MYAKDETVTAKRLAGWLVGWWTGPGPWDDDDVDVDVGDFLRRQ